MTRDDTAFEKILAFLPGVSKFDFIVYVLLCSGMLILYFVSLIFLTIPLGYLEHSVNLKPEYSEKNWWIGKAATQGLLVVNYYAFT